MALKIRCKDERGEVKNGCGIRVVLGICEGTQSMRAVREANRIGGDRESCQQICLRDDYN